MSCCWDCGVFIDRGIKRHPTYNDRIKAIIIITALLDKWKRNHRLHVDKTGTTPEAVTANVTQTVTENAPN